MALDNRGTSVQVDNNLLPPGYIKTPIVKVEGSELFEQNKIFQIGKGGVQNADEQTTMDNILSAIDSQMSGEIGAEFDDTANTVDFHSELVGLSINQQVAIDRFNEAPVLYNVEVNVFIKVS